MKKNIVKENDALRKRINTAFFTLYNYFTLQNNPCLPPPTIIIYGCKVYFFKIAYNSIKINILYIFEYYRDHKKRTSFHYLIFKNSFLLSKYYTMV